MIIKKKFFWGRACFLSFFVLAQSVVAQPAKEATNATDREKQFNTIRDFQSYDPATYQWSKIEEFRDIDILERKKRVREHKYIYRSFWAYDSVKHRWYKVDIRDHGYLRAQKPAAKKEKKKDTPNPLNEFFKNWAIGAKIGGGYCTEQTLWEGFTTSVSGKKILLHHNDKAYQLFFPSQRIAAYKGQKGSATSSNIETHTVAVPITFFTHYTFFKRVRLGVGGKIALKRFFIDAMSSKLPASDELEVLNQWINHPAWFGTLGFNLVQTNRAKIALEVRIGESYVLDSLQKTFIDSATGSNIQDLQTLWKTGRKNTQCEYLEKGTLQGIGLSYEQKLNGHWTLVGQLGGNRVLKGKLNDNVQSTDNVNIYAQEVLIYLDLGLQFNLGKDSPSKAIKPKKNTAKRRRKRK